jgi:hypothetical protein
MAAADIDILGSADVEGKLGGAPHHGDFLLIGEVLLFLFARARDRSRLGGSSDWESRRGAGAKRIATFERFI